jgi:hypothetical protein
VPGSGPGRDPLGDGHVDVHHVDDPEAVGHARQRRQVDRLPYRSGPDQAHTEHLFAHDALVPS